MRTEENPSVSHRQAAARENEGANNTRTIMQWGQRFKQVGGEAIAQNYIAAGKTDFEDFNHLLMRAVENRPPPVTEWHYVGMSERELGRYSVVRLFNALANPTDRRAQEAAAFEFEASRAWSARIGLPLARGGDGRSEFRKGRRGPSLYINSANRNPSIAPSTLPSATGVTRAPSK